MVLRTERVFFLWPKYIEENLHFVGEIQVVDFSTGNLDPSAQAFVDPEGRLALGCQAVPAG